MLIGHTPRCIDGARQQLTTGRKFRECSLRAQQGLLRAHANNLQLDEEFGGRRVEVSFRNSFLEIHSEVSHRGGTVVFDLGSIERTQMSEIGKNHLELGV